MTIHKKIIAVLIASALISISPYPASAVLEAPRNTAVKTAAVEKRVTVNLTRLSVSVTRSEARAALESPQSKYFDAEALAFFTTYSKGWSLQEWGCLRGIWISESHFNPKAHNKDSGAYGIAQFLPSTWGNYKVTKTSSPALQIKYGMNYVQKRYGSACSAKRFWNAHFWY